MFNVDQQGAGTLSVGQAVHKIHEDPAISGGITCARLHSPGEVLVSCTVQVPQTMRLNPISKRNTLPCVHEHASDLEEVLGLERGATDAPVEFSNQNATNALGRVESQDSKRDCNAWFPRTWRVGNGNPHQNPLTIQLSVRLPSSGEWIITNAASQDNMQCNGRPCSVGYQQARSYSIGWSASVNAFEWINAGFSVQRSIETGNQYTCYGDNQDFLCLWKNQAQTAFTVQNYRKYCDRNEVHGDPFVMWSPNENNRQGYYTITVYTTDSIAVRRVIGGWIRALVVPVVLRFRLTSLKNSLNILIS